VGIIKKKEKGGGKEREPRGGPLKERSDVFYALWGKLSLFRGPIKKIIKRE